MSAILKEVIHDLKQNPKRIQAKHMYNEEGGLLYQEIMKTDDYYVGRCETNIFIDQKKEISEVIQDLGIRPLDIIDLGAGDATKSRILLEQLMKLKIDFTYYPVDISSAVIQNLEETMRTKLPGISFRGFNGEYFEMLEKISKDSASRKVLLFLGNTIGNFFSENCQVFLKRIGEYLHQGDIIIIGFDLVKHPKIINSAYSTAVHPEWSINTLKSLNKRLNTNFQTDQFEYYSTYDPIVQTVNGFIISMRDQVVKIGNEEIYFERNEPIHLFLSKKFTRREIVSMASDCGFNFMQMFSDSQQWFADAVWEKK